MSQTVLKPLGMLQEHIISLSACDFEEGAQRIVGDEMAKMINILDGIAKSHCQDALSDTVEKVATCLMRANDLGKKAKNCIISSCLKNFIDFISNPSVMVEYRLEMLKNVNIVLENCAICTRQDLLSQDGFVHKLCSLMQSTLEAGDYEFQVCIIECLFRVIPKPRRADIMKRLPQFGPLTELFLTIRDGQFETDCRHVLNKVNSENASSSSRVYSFPAEMVRIDGERIYKPSDDDYDSLWIDFNTTSERIGIFIEPNTPQSQEGEITWETVSLWKHDVARCDCTTEGKLWRVVVELNPGALIYSSKDPDEQSHLVVILVSNAYPLQDALIKTFEKSNVNFFSHKKSSSASTPVSVLLKKSDSLLKPNSAMRMPCDTLPFNDSDASLSTLSCQSKRPSAKISVPVDPMITPASSVVSPSNQESAWYEVQEKLGKTDDGCSTQNKLQKSVPDLKRSPHSKKGGISESQLAKENTVKCSVSTTPGNNHACSVDNTANLNAENFENKDHVKIKNKNTAETSCKALNKIPSKLLNHQHKQKSKDCTESIKCKDSKKEQTTSIKDLKTGSSSTAEDEINSQFVRRSQRNINRQKCTGTSKQGTSHSSKQSLKSKEDGLKNNTSTQIKNRNTASKNQTNSLLKPNAKDICASKNLGLINSTDSKTPPSKRVRPKKKIKTPVVTVQIASKKSESKSEIVNKKVLANIDSMIMSSVHRQEQEIRSNGGVLSQDILTRSCNEMVQEPTISSVYEAEMKRQASSYKHGNCPHSEDVSVESTCSKLQKKKLISPGYVSEEDFKPFTKDHSKKSIKEDTIKNKEKKRSKIKNSKANQPLQGKDSSTKAISHQKRSAEQDSNSTMKNVQSSYQFSDDKVTHTVSDAKRQRQNCYTDYGAEGTISSKYVPTDEKNTEILDPKNKKEKSDSERYLKAVAVSDLSIKEKTKNDEFQEAYPTDSNYSERKSQLDEVSLENKADLMHCNDKSKVLSEVSSHKNATTRNINNQEKPTTPASPKNKAGCGEEESAGIEKDKDIGVHNKETTFLKSFENHQHCLQIDADPSRATQLINTKMPCAVSPSSSGVLYIEANHMSSATDFIEETQLDKLLPKVQHSHLGAEVQNEMNICPIDPNQCLEKNSVSKMHKLNKMKGAVKLPLNFGFEEENLHASGDHNLPNTEPQVSSNMECSYVFNRCGFSKNIMNKAGDQSKSISLNVNGNLVTESDVDCRSKKFDNMKKVKSKEDNAEQGIDSFRSNTIALSTDGGGYGLETAKCSEEGTQGRLVRQLRKRNKEISYKECESVDTSLSDEINPHVAYETKHSTPFYTDNQSKNIVAFREKSLSDNKTGYKKEQHNIIGFTSPQNIARDNKKRTKTFWTRRGMKTTVTTTFDSKPVKSKNSADPYNFEADSSTCTDLAFVPFRPFPVNNRTLNHTSSQSKEQPNINRPKASKYKQKKKKVSIKGCDQFALYSSQKHSTENKLEKGNGAKQSIEFSLFSSQRSQVRNPKSEQGLIFPPLEDSLPCTPCDYINNVANNDLSEKSTKKSILSQRSWTTEKIPSEVRKKMRGKTYNKRDKKYLEHKDSKENEADVEQSALYQSLYHKQHQEKNCQRKSAISKTKASPHTLQRRKSVDSFQTKITPERLPSFFPHDKKKRSNAHDRDSHQIKLKGDPANSLGNKLLDPQDCEMVSPFHPDRRSRKPSALTARDEKMAGCLGSDKLDLKVSDTMCSGPPSTRRPNQSSLKRKYNGLVSSSSDHDDASDVKFNDLKHLSLPRKLFKLDSVTEDSVMPRNDMYATPRILRKRPSTKVPQDDLSTFSMPTFAVKKAAQKKQPAQASPMRKRRKSQRKLELSPINSKSKDKHRSKSDLIRPVINFDLSCNLYSSPEKNRNCLNTSDFEKELCMSPTIPLSGSTNESAVGLSQLSTPEIPDGSEKEVCATSHTSHGSLSNFLTRKDMAKRAAGNDVEVTTRPIFKYTSPHWDNEPQKRINALKKIQIVTENVMACISQYRKDLDECEESAFVLWEQMAGKLRRHRYLHEKQLTKLRKAHSELRQQLQQIESKNESVHNEHSLEAVRRCLHTSLMFS